jgi:hypothetical protein
VPFQPYVFVQHACLAALIGASLAGCTRPPTYAEVQATAEAQGCWPARYPTPVAPRTTAVVATSGQTTTSMLPTATPLPLCPPEMGEATTPLPTPIPPPKPYPTMRPEQPQNSAALQTAFELPGRVYQLDLAAHPTENWPVVAAMHRQSLLDEPIQIFVRVFDLQAKRWGVAQQVDVGEASAGSDKNGSVAVAISGDDTVHAVWGASDADGGIWTSTSSDYGTNWSKPQRIAQGCTVVNDVQATVDGQLVVLAMCGRLPTHPTLIVRRTDGTWLPPKQLSIPGWFGALVVVGDGPEARAVALVTGQGAGMPNDIAYFISGSLHRGDWQVQSRPLSVPGDYFFHQQGLVFAQANSDEPGALFTFKGQYTPSLYALLSRDGGRTFGPVETIVGGEAADNGAAQDRDVAFVAPAAGPDHLLALWTCCGDAQKNAPATHYASSRALDDGAWQPNDPQKAVPLILGSRSAGATVSAQAVGAGDVWVAWVEKGKQVRVRSIPAVQLVGEVTR